MKLAAGVILAVVGLADVMLAGAAHADDVAINGAGSSFAAPLYGKWGEAAKAPLGVALNYQAIGSGGGQNQVINRVVDFGASDAPVSADRLQTNNLLQVPTAMGAVDVVVNVPGIAGDQIRLDGPTLANIYRGKIVKWNDAAIAALNPDMNLPAIAIAPVYRADGSGTTFVFTDYLSLVSPDWKEAVGANTSVKWPAGTGARGSDGVAGTVRQVRGAIGYVEAAYATQNHLAAVQLKNKDGAWVKPEPANFAAAVANADWTHAEHFAVDLNDQPGATSWPIVSATYVLIPTDPKDKAKHDAVVKFFDWGLAHGDEIAVQLNYVALPKAVKDRVHTALHAE